MIFPLGNVGDMQVCNKGNIGMINNSGLLTDNDRVARLINRISL